MNLKAFLQVTHSVNFVSSSAPGPWVPYSLYVTTAQCKGPWAVPTQPRTMTGVCVHWPWFSTPGSVSRSMLHHHSRMGNRGAGTPFHSSVEVHTHP